MVNRVSVSNKSDPAGSRPGSNGQVPRTSSVGTKAQSNGRQPEGLIRPSTAKTSNAKSLRFLLLRGVLPAVLVPLAIAGVVGERTIHQRLEEDLSKQVRTQSLLTSELTRDYLLQVTATAKLIAENPVVVDAARSATGTFPEINDLPIEEVEARFAQAKLLQPNAALNNYLASVVTTADLGELSFTDKRGLNVAYSNISTDFVQSDEEWWQRAQSDMLYISEPGFDASADAYGLEINHAIQDPASGEFLGVVKAFASVQSSHFEDIPEVLQLTELTGSQQVQVIDAASGTALQTVTAGGTSEVEDVSGGAVVVSIATALSDVFNRAEAGNPNDLAAIADNLQSQYPIRELEITEFTTEEGISGVIAEFISEGRKYYLSAIAETSLTAIASIDHNELEAAGRQLILVFALTMMAAAGVATFIILRLANQLSSPLRYLSSAAEEVASGNLDVEVAPYGAQEAQTLANTFNGLVSRVRDFLQEQTNAADQARLLSEIVGSTVRDESDLAQIFNKALTESRTALDVDRMVIYRFNNDWSGYVSHESVAAGWPEALSESIEDPCIPQELIEAYQQGRTVPTNDTFNAGFHPEHRKLMQQLKVRANLVVPILKESRLFGLLVAHHCGQTHMWQNSEIAFMRQLAVQLGSTLDQLTYIQAREDEAKWAEFLRDFTVEVAQGGAPEDILNRVPLQRLRDVLEADRVVIYQFDEAWKGTITHESVFNLWPRALGAAIYDPCFEKNYVKKYEQGRVQVTNNIYEANLTECHLKQLEPFEVKANLVAPIRDGEKLLGLLIAHQCSGPREWQSQEINAFSQVASLIGQNLERGELFLQRELAIEQTRSLADEQRNQKESLQVQLVNLLGDVEGAASGDLTVRADVTAGEIGTVADFFNSIIENLRQLVTQVKTSAQQVNMSVGDNAGAIRLLADNAMSQADEMTLALSSVEAMTRSIQSVASSAREAAQVARAASETAEMGTAAMGRTEENILSLRETVGVTAKQVKRLGESSQQISKVVSLINQIAVQTNLLAINAGIEAARAGEGGQGFAVVAEEVGELANRSAAATQEIEKIVETIQRETAQVVEAMEQSTTQVVEGTRSVEETKVSLSQILDVSRQIDQLVQSISTATVSQVETSTSVSQLMQTVAEVSKETSNSSLQVSDALRSTVQVTEELQASVGTFKVEGEG